MRLEAKHGQESAVEAFLASALPLVQQEAGTTAWFAIRFGRGEYGIFDVFADEAGRDAHLGGPVAQALGQQAAGIAPGHAGWADLATGGRNTLPGDGFRSEFDDGTPQQVRHFAGTAAAALRMGSTTTRVLSRLRGDVPGSADDRLSAAAIAFAHDLSHGTLSPADAGDWVRRRLVDQTGPTN